MTPCCAVYSNLKTFEDILRWTLQCWNATVTVSRSFLSFYVKFLIIMLLVFCHKIRIEFCFCNAQIFRDFSCLHITNDVCNVARLHFSSFAFSSDLFRTTNKQILLFSRHISKIHFPLKNCVLCCKWTKKQLLCKIFWKLFYSLNSRT